MLVDISKECKVKKIFQYLNQGKRNENYKEKLLGDMEENSTVSSVHKPGEKSNEKNKQSKDSFFKRLGWKRFKSSD